MPDRILRLTEVVRRGIVHVAGTLKTFDILSLPESPNQCSARCGILAAWIGPDRWLLIGSLSDAERWSSTPHSGGAIADLSSGRAIVRVEGEQWPALLARGCPLDSGTAFPRGKWSCAQSLFCEVPVFVLVPPSGQWAEMFVPGSYRAFFWRMLESNARSLRYEVGSPTALAIP